MSEEELVLKSSVCELAAEFFCFECRLRYGDDVCPSICRIVKFMDAVYDMPTEDIHRNGDGYWTDFSVSISGTSSARCSRCGAVMHADDLTPPLNYCPNCGANMHKTVKIHE